MAPTKCTQSALLLKPGAKTRNQVIASKRKADESPMKRATVKRAVPNSNFLEVTKENAVQLVKARITTTATLNKVTIQSVGTQKPASGKPKLTVRKPLADQKNVFHCTNNVTAGKSLTIKAQKVPLPAPSESTNLENVHPSSRVPSTVSTRRSSLLPVPIKSIRKQQIQAQTTGVMTRKALAKKSLELETSSESSLLEESSKPREPAKVIEWKPPPGVNDFDREQLPDLFSASLYAMDIFDYMKSKEPLYPIKDYLQHQKDLNYTMRALLVDWMVEVQENFEINHESLYLGVKLVDLYLSKNVIQKENLQLVGISSIFVASKYDERIPPVLDEFVYVCDGLYKRKDVIRMERMILRSVDYELGIPLSYCFLRRYSRCAKYDMQLLTLARFILETSLMNYQTIRCSDSKMAASVLFIALNMKGLRWNKTLEYYSSYRPEDLQPLVYKINDFLHKPMSNLQTIRKKYSHESFYAVATVPLVPNDKLDFKTQ